MITLGLLHERLSRGLWHTTLPDRFLSIMQTGAIMVEPPVPDGDRWMTARGPDFWPFVRTIGGVSLFAFEGVDLDALDRDCPLCSWREFVPHRPMHGVAVWIEVDRTAIADRFRSAESLRIEWEAGLHRHTRMPRIEAACIGDVPVTTFLSAFVTWDGGASIRELRVNPQDAAFNEQSLEGAGIFAENGEAGRQAAEGSRGKPIMRKFLPMEAFKEGAEAFRRGRPLESCPFPAGSTEARDWNDGYLDAENDARQDPVEDDPRID